MQSWLIKIGKGISAFREDGIVAGLRKVIVGFRARSYTIGSGDVLFVASGTGASALYRTHHVAEALNVVGIHASVALSDDARLIEYVDRFRVFVFHRTFYSDSVKKVVKKIKDQNKAIFFDTDDLVFDAELFQKTSLYQKMNPLERIQYQNGVGKEFLSDTYVRVCTTSTHFLANRLQEFNKKAVVVPNMLSRKDQKDAERAIVKSNRKDAKRVRLAYMSGSKSHDADFSVITKSLVDILQKYDTVDLHIVGALVLDDVYKKYHYRIFRHSFMDRSKMFLFMAEMDIFLSPLVVGDPFCEAKSEIKWSEAALVQKPIVASATRTFWRTIEDGEDGYIADSTDEWTEKLSRLIDSSRLRAHLGQRARKKVLSRSTTDALSKEYVDIIQGILTSS